MPDSVYIILFFLTLLLVRIVHIFFHEMGHALTGLILMKGNFNVYLGSYGDPGKGWHFKVGKRLTLHLIYNPFSWDRGLCVPGGESASYKREFLFTLGGPLGSLVLALLCFSLVFTRLDEVLKVYAFLAALYAFVNFLHNLMPKSSPIKLYNGSITYNDGYSLKRIFKEKHNYELSVNIARLWNKKDYDGALALYEQTDRAKLNPLTYRLAAYMYLNKKNYEASVITFIALQKVDALTADDHCNFALAYSYLYKYTEAFEHYNQSLTLKPDHVYSLNNRGYTYNLVDNYEVAMADFDKAIGLDPLFPHAYNNRGLAKIKLGAAEEGLADIERSLQLDASNAYAYRNKGIYYLEQKNYNEAYDLFVKAKDMDAFTHEINDYLEKTKQLITATSR